MEVFWTGVLAGYGIAIPVGAIAVLIVETGMRCGFRCGAGAGAGAATADLIYAAAAVFGGAAVTSVIEAVDEPFRYTSAAVLVAIAIFGLWRAHRDRNNTAHLGMPDRARLLATYAKFLGLTIINPLTIIYFAAFVVGLGVAEELTVAQGFVFAAGAFLSSLSWQTFLAAAGALARKALPPGFRTATVIGGNLIVLALAVWIVLR